MVFNSGAFLASFAAFTFAYYAAPHRWRWILILTASAAFYSTFSLAYVFLLTAVTLLAYVAGRGMDAAIDERRRRTLLIGSVAAIVTILASMKYVEAPGAPVGLSFYSLSSISYLADVYARRLNAERHVGYFAAYLSFFPKLLAGPIERARGFLESLRQPVRFSHQGTTEGLQLFLWGLVKKVVIADRLALIVDAAYSQTSFASPADLLVATYLFAFQLYCDFSGYSDMAIGAAKVLGFDLMENFRRPYLSATVSEFWSTRWHVSLATWFRDYVYIPLGGSRVSSARWAFNVMAVFLLSGFWHGAAWTFIVWGGLNGVYVVISTLLRRTRRPASPSSTWGPALAGPDVSTGPMAAVRALATFHFVLVTWVFFRAASIEEAITVLTRVASSATRLPALVWARLASPEVATAVALVAVLMAIEWIDERRPMWQRLSGTATVVRWSAYYALAIALLVLGVWNAQQFVYMQF